MVDGHAARYLSAALSLVISLNVQRREMTAAQRAIVAARALPLFEEMAAARKTSGTKSSEGRRSRDDAAKIFKVGVNAVQRAKAILAESPDLAAQIVDTCTISPASCRRR